MKIYFPSIANCKSVVLNLGFAGRFPGVLGWQLSFHVLLFLISYTGGKLLVTNC